MKRISFFSTPFYMYLTEVPFVIILVLAIIYNPYAEGMAQLYPLMAAMVAAIIFSNIFLYRAVSISRCRVRDVGRFSRRDFTTLSAGNSIRLVPMEQNRVRVYVYAEAGLPELDWMRDQTTNPDEICTYRGRTQGGLCTVADTLSYFEVPTDEVEKIVSGADFNGDYPECRVSIHKTAEGRTEYRIELKRSVLELDFDEIELSCGVEIRSKRTLGGEWETDIFKDGEHISTHRSRNIKKQLSRVLHELELSPSDVREYFSGGDLELENDLVYASVCGGAYTVRVK